MTRETPTSRDVEHISLNIPAVLKKRAQHAALDRGCSLTDLIVQGLEIVLKKGAGK